MEIILRSDDVGEDWEWILMKGKKEIANSSSWFTRKASAKRNAAIFLKNMVYSSHITIAD